MHTQQSHERTYMRRDKQPRYNTQTRRCANKKLTRCRAGDDGTGTGPCFEHVSPKIRFRHRQPFVLHRCRR